MTNLKSQMLHVGGLHPIGKFRTPKTTPPDETTTPGWVTYHGCALNVNNDLSGFDEIKPCGFSSEVMTSLEVELEGSCPSMSEVKESFLRHFSRHFERLLVV